MEKKKIKIQWSTLQYPTSEKFLLISVSNSDSSALLKLLVIQKFNYVTQSSFCFLHACILLLQSVDVVGNNQWRKQNI